MIKSTCLAVTEKRCAERSKEISKVGENTQENPALTVYCLYTYCCSSAQYETDTRERDRGTTKRG